MAVTAFVLDICFTLLLSGVLLYSYGNWMRQRLAVTLSVLIAWYFSFLIIFILPLDVSNTVYKQCLNQYNQSVDTTEIDATNITTTHAPQTSEKPELSCIAPNSLLDDQVLLDLWRVVYWSSQLLTWLILPMMQSYTQAGEFTVRGKLKSALWDNAIYYASVIFIALILVIYIALQPNLHLDRERIKAIAAAASNTWGLFVLVLMLGYGLVEVPRNCWRNSQRGFQLNRSYFKLAKLMGERSDAEEAVDDTLISLNAISQIVGQSDLRRPNVETILQKVPLELMEKIRRRRADASFGSDPPTEKTLVRLHRQVIRTLQNLHRTEAQWDDLTKKIIDLEDINRNMISNEHVFKRTSTLENKSPSLIRRTVYSPTIEWYWKCLFSPLLLRVAAVLAAIMSAFIVWSEVTFFSMHPPLSLFAVFINLAKSNYNYVAIEIISFLTICYLSLCAYYTVFKIRVLNYYYLAKNHQSDEYTLLFSGALLCRLTPPLCLNFLSIIHMDSHVIKSQIMETSYTQVMGHMDLIAIVSDYFNIYFPIALLGLSLATYFSLGARALSMIGFQQFLDQESELTLEMVEEGKEHMRREKRRLQRLYESSTRRREFSARTRAVPMGEEMSKYHRTPDIVKSSLSENRPVAVASPERSLLDNQPKTSPQRRIDDDVETGVGEIVNVNEDVKRGRNEPPRNLFDDW